MAAELRGWLLGDFVIKPVRETLLPLVPLPEVAILIETCTRMYIGIFINSRVDNTL